MLQAAFLVTSCSLGQSRFTPTLLYVTIPCAGTKWDWGSKPEYWEQKAADARRGMESRIAELKAAGWSDADAGQVARDYLEKIEVCSVNIELLNRIGSFDDPAWIERRSLAARERLEAETDPVMMLGHRKLVRKWNEEIVRFHAEALIKSRLACGNQAAAQAAYDEFVAWMNRPDRKDRVTLAYFRRPAFFSGASFRLLLKAETRERRGRLLLF